MPRHKGGFWPRNQNKGRGKRESHLADPNAREHSPKSPHSLSRTRSGKLPSDNHNKPSPQKISINSSTEDNLELSNIASPNSEPSLHPVNVLDDIEHVHNLKLLSDNPATTPEVGDNRGLSVTPAILPQPSQPTEMELPPTIDNPEKTLQSTPDDPWHLTFNELRAMRSRMQTLGKLETATLDFAKQLQAISSKTASTETKVQAHSTKIEELQQNITTLRNTVESQQNIILELQQNKNDISQMKEDILKNSQKIADSQLSKNDLIQMQKELQENTLNIETLSTTKEELLHMKQDFSETSQSIKDNFNKSSHKNISEMNKLVEAQKNQVESFKSIRNDIQQDIRIQKARIRDVAASQESLQQQVDDQIKDINDNIEHTNLKKQALDNMRNIVVIGLPEHKVNSAYSVVMKFFRSKLNLKKLDIQMAYRIGKPPVQNSSYIRPLLVKFYWLSDRNAVWRSRNDIPQDDEQQTIRIQADLPKQLREDVTTLYRVQQAASKTADYQNATIRDYALILHDKKYTASQLETLPHPIRPSTLACKKSEHELVFFSKHSALSNHHPATFKIDDRTYNSMEHYLAFKRAEVANNDHLKEKALKAKDPVEAKSVLNALRQTNAQEWQEKVTDIALNGLRAKFGQNTHLAQYLRATKELRLGEASKNPTWGIGMTLDHKQVLDSTKWNASGNLLGVLLMQIRSEISRSEISQ